MPLGTPRIAIGRICTARTTLIFAAEPVVTSTNHGSARYVIREPSVEISSATTSAPTARLFTCAPCAREYNTSVRFCKVRICRRSPKSTRSAAASRSSRAPAAASRATATRARPSHGSSRRSASRAARSSTTSRTRTRSSSSSRSRRHAASRTSGSTRASARCSTRSSHEDPDWLAVQFEATRRIRTDPEFRRVGRGARAGARGHAAPSGSTRLRPQVRDDVPLETVAIFLSFVANGLALRQTMGDPLPDLDADRAARRRRRRAALAASRGRTARVPRPSVGDGCPASCACARGRATRRDHGRRRTRLCAPCHRCPTSARNGCSGRRPRSTEPRLVTAESVRKDRLRTPGCQSRQPPGPR